MTRRTRLGFYIGGAAAGVLVAILVPILVVFVFTAARFSLPDNLPSVVIFSWDTDEAHSMPLITGNRQFGYEWEIVSQRYVDGSNASVIEWVNEYEPSEYTMAPLSVNQERVNIHFRANITHSRGTAALDWHFQVRCITFPEFTHLFSPNQTNRVAYRIQGLAHRRVFGTHDLDWDNATQFQRAGYKQAFDIMQIATRYRGGLDALDLEVFVVDIAVNNQSGIQYALDNHDIGLNNLIVDVNDTDIEAGRVRVDFKSTGVVTVIVRGTHDVSGIIQYYFYTYEIVEGVNAHTFADVKAVEYNARMNYIRHGVRLRGPSGINADGPIGYLNNATERTIVPRHLAFELIPALDSNLAVSVYRRLGETLSETNPLNSALFHLGVNYGDLPPGASNPGDQQRQFVREATPRTRAFSSEYLRELARWAPAFTYRDLIIRNNMQTWEEATWFFGSVHGNGHTIDATPYAENSARVHRNAHTTGWESEGLENASFAPGMGWGDQYAFYALSNHSVIDNLHLVGHNIVNPGGAPVRLDQYNRVGVISVSGLGGYDRSFQIGQRHDNGVFRCGMYNADITISHAIIEKGLMLVGAYYIPNAKFPMRVENSVLRNSGFTGVFARGMHGWSSVADRNRGRGSEGGHLVAFNNEKGRVDGIVEDRQDLLAIAPSGWNEYRSFGVFIELHNIFTYENTTTPIIVDDGVADTHLVVTGDHNAFYTWIRVTDLVMPTFKLPDSPRPGRPHSLEVVPDVTGIAQDLIRTTLATPEFADAALIDGPHTWINLPLISVGVDTGTIFDLSGIPGEMRDIYMDIPVGGMGLSAVGIVPASVVDGITMEVQRELFEHGSLTRRINEWAAMIRTS
ncbi:MAG: hypothetical protein FWE31_01960 [Firmicutes bacterium]|nr:hypothetical protein [Bacillota bacterium]